MPVSSIAQVFIRLYSLKLVVGAAAGMVGLICIMMEGDRDSWFRADLLTALLPNLGVMASGVILWMLAPLLSRWLTGKNNGSLTLQGVSQQTLYTAVLLGLGVYFFMDSFANMFGWLHYFIRNHEHGIDGFRMTGEPSYYDLGERLLTMAAGIALMMTCRTWARRISGKSESGPEAIQ